MSNKKTQEVWAGPGVLSLGRRKIAVGDPIPEELNSTARKSLRGSGKIIDQVIKDEDKPVDLKAIAKAAEEAASKAQELSDEAMTKLGVLTTAVEDARKAVPIAKGQSTKAANAAKANDASDEAKAEAAQAADALATVETALKDAESAKTEATTKAEALAENVSRTRMEADKAAEAAK